MSSLELSPGLDEKILEQAIQSPAAAILRLSFEIDRQLRLILAVIGRLNDYTGPSPNDALDLIAMSNVKPGIPPALRDTLRNFWDLRNLLVHGRETGEGLAMRSVDYGLRILRMLQAVPRPSFVVIESVKVFSDAACTIERPDVSGIILEHLGPNNENYGRHIHPSRKNYVQGQSVSWEWDRTGYGWGKTWHRDSESGKIKSAWGESLEFIGRPLEAL
jgi:hypothetical protein